MKFVAVIPARYSSTRFRGKPLAMLQDKPLIQWVYDAVKETELFDDVIVATDDVKIFDTVKRFGGKVMKTLDTHKSGTDRIVEVCTKIQCDVVVNVQGDEPFITKSDLEPLLKVFEDKNVLVASLYKIIDEKEEVDNRNVVKIVIDNQGNAMYFSRLPIPFNRDNISGVNYYKHIGVYAYRKDILMQFNKLKSSDYEHVEKLEQLRFLQNGISIKMVKTNYEGIGIDTKEDLEKAEQILQQRRK